MLCAMLESRVGASAGEECIGSAGCVVCAASAGEEGVAASFEGAILAGARAAWQDGASERQVIRRPIHHHNATNVVGGVSDEAARWQAKHALREPWVGIGRVDNP